MSEPLRPIPASQQAQLRLPPQSMQGQIEDSSELKPGHSYPGEIVKLLGQVSGKHRYELSIFNQHMPALSSEAFDVGTILRVVPILKDGQYHLEIRGLWSPGLAIEQPEVQEPRPQQVESTEHLLARALQQRGWTPPSHRELERLPSMIRDNSLPLSASAEVISQAYGSRLPLNPAMLRAGANMLLESADPLPLKKQLIELLKPHVDEKPQLLSATQRLSDSGSMILTDFSDEPEQRHSQVSRPLPELFVQRLRLAQLQSSVQNLVNTVLNTDTTLAKIGELIEEIQFQQLHVTGKDEVGPVLAERVSQLLSMEEATFDRSLLKGLDQQARFKALLMLKEMEQQRIQSHNLWQEISPIVKELYHRTEAAAYLQLLEFSSREHHEDQWMSGYLPVPDGPAKFRMRVRDERRKSKPKDSIGFVIELESSKLGRVQASGKLSGNPKPEAAPLQVHLAAQEVDISQRIHNGLPNLVSRLADRGFECEAVVGQWLGLIASASEEDEVRGVRGASQMTPEDGLDVKG